MIVFESIWFYVLWVEDDKQINYLSRLLSYLSLFPRQVNFTSSYTRNTLHDLRFLIVLLNTIWNVSYMWVWKNDMDAFYQAFAHSLHSSDRLSKLFIKQVVCP